ncbi:condensin-2 complex subunit H2 [Aplysia californica]|uniref:Condensin-2 complex subunit H2 n=1 Tax=Aplysia californica TaxID=6500 RepID=A0ABM1A404_APLCA|nr:condensin-2 complex subunit H2 [Aplysia californica]
MSFSSSQEERFSAILQPIRDLARNWDIDIAHYLEEYLEDLEKVEITFDDGSTTMNFSEAALLIQGSAGVYAKKVEYLYGLVFQVLDLVTQKKKQKNKSGEEGEENGGEEDNFADDDQFLLLDDIEETEGSYMKEVDTSTSKSVLPIPQMPTCLIPLEEAQKGDNPVCNNKGEVVGNYFDFIINTGHTGKDSSLSLELGDRALLDMAAIHQNRLQDLAEEDLSGCRGDFAPPVSDDVEMDDLPLLPVDDGGDADMGDDCGGLDAPGQKSQSADERNAALRKSRRKRVTFARPEPKQVFDKWALLDPHDKGKAAEKPLKKKIPYKIPAGLEDDTSRKRKIKVEIKKELPPINEVVEKMFSNRSSFPKNPLKIPDFPELDGAFWKEYKLREKIKKEEIKMLKMEEQLEELSLEAEAEEELRDEEFPHDDLDNAADDDEIPVIQLDTDAFGSDLEHGRRFISSDMGYQTGFSDDITLSYEELVRRHVEQFLASASEYAQLTDLSKKVSEWEEKIKPRLEEEEKHEAFDIHKYGTQVIEQLVRGETRAFKELVQGKPQFEVCRCALATLQLANVYNVELSVVPDKNGCIIDQLYVTLLSTKRHFEELEEYRAPSVHDVKDS